MSRAAAYLDHNATSHLRPEAQEAMRAAMETWGNPSSVHAAGRAAKALLETAREQVAGAVGACAEDLVFTSGGTEANALALAGGLKGAGLNRLIVSAIEHDSVLEAARALGREGAEVSTLPVNADGLADLDALREAMAGEPALVSLMLANNETGAIQPVAEAAAVVREAGGVLHVDAAQGLARMPVSLAETGADLLTLSAHKAGGPAGIGALVLGASETGGARIARIQHGGGHERGHRAGTENLIGAAGFGAVAAAGLWPNRGALTRMRDEMESAIKQIAPQSVVYAEAAPRLANTSCFAAPGFPGETQVMALDLAGVAVSAGSACSSGKVSRSHVLEAMGADDDMAGSAIRVSLGWDTTDDDVARLIDAWREAYSRVKARAA